MVIRYRREQTGIAAVECAEVGYPHDDADGFVQYENSHYDTPEEAWTGLLAERSAHVSLAGHRVAEAKRALLKAQEYAGDAAELFAEATRNRDSGAVCGGGE